MVCNVCVDVSQFLLREGARKALILHPLQRRPPNSQALTLHTTLGDLKLELACGDCPRTCENFLALAASGYYDGTLFHRNIRGFMIQGGDPSGTGKGGKSIFATATGKFPDELVDSLKHSKRGVVSMANSGPNTNGSQFFITYKAHAHLNGKYTVFGQVIDGMDTLDRMEKVPVLNSCPRVLMEEIAQQLRRRCAWLAFEEQREYKRAKALNIMGRPGSVPPASPGVGTRDGADAFCLGVLQDNTSPGIFETGPTAVAEPDPGRVPIAVFSGDVLLLIWGLSWWALSYSPFNVVGRLMDLRPVTTLANVALSILRAGIIAQRVDYMVATYPGHNIAAIVIAIIASSGGGMIVDALDIGAGYSKGPAELATPGFVLRSGAFLAIFHLASVHLLGLLSSRASLGVITTLFVAHTLASAILQAPLDYTRPLGILLHKVTNIPVPVGGKTKAPPSKPVTRSQAALSKEVDGHQEQYPSTPSSSKQTPRRRTTAGKRE
ncbi:Peptidyl-prolyl cis-trans isomerase-like 3 [Auxenochlorella protothecoides]|uniref:Peptidyl-prolyl cis-trans isomerase-like 3 n=1 Tax=Auxenochlorella protothecoides TaxID=3075 RepID=A0A087SQP8_AUXPR|nr:Peptidyl-prolyl cis-trans isomerase-like 3 [Auxenochlorella protothecoides]KFM28052.1 Peptidyl-prolyl cis-trans isomerase-like 3 [Auxenochlorella protothecoides]